MAQRHAWLAPTRPARGTVDFGGVVHHDFQTGAVTQWDPGPHRSAGEWLFVPRSAPADTTLTRDDGDGWIMSYVYDASRDRSDLVVLEATDVARGPVATVHLPARVPYGFHATWVPT